MAIGIRPTPRNLQRLQFRWHRDGRHLTVNIPWYELHNKLLKHAGVGGKGHSFERGHVPWNRKGRW